MPAPDLARIVKEFILSFEFVRMKPDNSVIKDGVPENGRAWALVERGRAYAICLVGSGPTELTLELPEGVFRAEWIDPSTGRSIKQRISFMAAAQGSSNRLSSVTTSPYALSRNRTTETT